MGAIKPIDFEMTIKTLNNNKNIVTTPNDTTKSIDMVDISTESLPVKQPPTVTPALTVSNEYIQEGFDAEYYNQQLKEYLSHFTTTREKTVAAAIFLSTMFPKIHYLKGGGHTENTEELRGIDPEWGKIIESEYSFKDIVEHKAKSDVPNGLDCSGLVMWCLKNGGYEDVTNRRAIDYLKIGESINMFENEKLYDQVQKGDLCYKDNKADGQHIGIIVDIDKDNKLITVAHTSGSGDGTNLTTISTETTKIVKDEIGSRGTDRVKNPEYNNYFDTIIKVPYEENTMIVKNE